MKTLWRKIGQYLSKYVMNEESAKETDVCGSTTGFGLHERYSEVVNSGPLSSESDNIEGCSDSEPKYNSPNNGEIPECSYPKNYLPSNMEISVQESIKDCSPNSQSNDQLIYSVEKLTDSGIKHLSTTSDHTSPNTKTHFLNESRPCEVYMTSLSTNLVSDSSSKPSYISAAHQVFAESWAESCQSAPSCFSAKKSYVCHKQLKRSAIKSKHECVYERECHPCEVSLERLSSDQIRHWLSIGDKRCKLDQNCVPISACLSEDFPSVGDLDCDLSRSDDYFLSLSNTQSVSSLEHCNTCRPQMILPVSVCAAKKGKSVFKKEYQPCVVRLERLPENLTKELLNVHDRISNLRGERCPAQYLNR